MLSIMVCLSSLELAIQFILRLELLLKGLDSFPEVDFTPDAGKQKDVEEEQAYLVEVVGLEEAGVVEDDDVGCHCDDLQELHEWGLVEVQETQREQHGGEGQSVVVEALG